MFFIYSKIDKYKTKTKKQKYLYTLFFYLLLFANECCTLLSIRGNTGSPNFPLNLALKNLALT